MYYTAEYDLTKLLTIMLCYVENICQSSLRRSWRRFSSKLGLTMHSSSEDAIGWYMVIGRKVELTFFDDNVSDGDQQKAERMAAEMATALRSLTGDDELPVGGFIRL